MAASDSNDTATAEVRWTEGALKRMERAPVFLRGMVRRLAEKKARELGYAEITEATLEQFKSQMMGGMGGASGMTEAAEAMAQGRLLVDHHEQVHDHEEHHGEHRDRG